MEHLAFFNLAQDPFRNDPELDLFFRGTPQRSASRRLVRLARQGKELSLLVGESGVGKTTLLRSFFEELEPEAFEPALLVVSAVALAALIVPQSAVTELTGLTNPAMFTILAMLFVGLYLWV